jgi:hypothetical protein
VLICGDVYEAFSVTSFAVVCAMGSHDQFALNAQVIVNVVLSTNPIGALMVTDTVFVSHVANHHRFTSYCHHHNDVADGDQFDSDGYVGTPFTNI